MQWFGRVVPALDEDTYEGLFLLFAGCAWKLGILAYSVLVRKFISRRLSHGPTPFEFAVLKTSRAS
jgi:hypothetical protein